MCRFAVYVLLVGTSLMYSSCSNAANEENAFAKVGGKILPRESYQYFTTMQRMYPAQKSTFFPGDRKPASALVETQVLFSDASGKNKLKSTQDWRWKQRYYPAQMYAQQILSQNLGFTEEEIEDYYSRNREKYKDTITVTIPADTARLDTVSDTTSADSLVKPQTKDSVVYQPLSKIRRQVLADMFLSEYPPDSAFYSQMTSPNDTTIDSAMVRQRWLMTISRNPTTFFMQQLYEDKFNEPYPDSVDAFFGEGKYITPQDLDIILEWLPEQSRKDYESQSKRKFLVEWLLKWKLFSEQARESGFVNNEDVQGVLDWAWKYEVATNHIEENILPDAKKEIPIDTSMIVFGLWDDGLTAGKMPDSARLAGAVQEYRNEAISINLENKINSLRKKRGVEFLQSDWKDDKTGDPVALKQKADSLLALEEKNTGQQAAQLLRSAEQTLRTLVDVFPYSEVGQEALIDLAKVQTELANLEQGRKRTMVLRNAIENYRRYLIYSEKPQKRCNTFFMIGFIYDEHLERSSLAEVNYKWILQHTPDCELADDAEFMIQHLDEPMTSIEELQAQSRRQGRPVEQEELEEISDTTVNTDSILE
ncbi:MAG: hypothetical protein ACOC4C_01425 [Fibrobacterota bacterium]